MQLEQILVLVGALLFIALAVAHLCMLLFGRQLSAADDVFNMKMQQTPIRLGNNVSMWQAWTGINYGISVSLLFFGVTYLLLGWLHFELIEAAVWFLLIPLFYSGFCLFLANRLDSTFSFATLFLATLSFSMSAFSLTF